MSNTGKLKATLLPFPDKAYKARGWMVEETVAAMRKANGDRAVAAKLLNTSMANLASRLHRIRVAVDKGLKV